MVAIMSLFIAFTAIKQQRARAAAAIISPLSTLKTCHRTMQPVAPRSAKGNGQFMIDTTHFPWARRFHTSPPPSVNRMAKTSETEPGDESPPKNTPEGSIDQDAEWRLDHLAVDFLNQECFLEPPAQSFNEDTFKRRMDSIPIKTIKDLIEAFKEKNDRTVVACSLAGLDFQEVKKKLNEMTIPPEDQLNGKILNYFSETHQEITKAQERYIGGAAKFVDSGADGTRQDDIVLVMGPSGSGKTLYALKGLPNPCHFNRNASESNGKEDRMVTIYYCISGSIAHDPSRLLGELEEAIQKRLGKSANDYDPSKRLNMGLRLVIDEAAVFGDWLADFENLEKISGALKSVATSVQVAFVGTGLDTITKNMNSQTQVRKYRMRPWGIKQLKTVVEDNNRLELDQPGKDKLVDKVSREPVFLNLATNARAAWLLIVVLSWRVKWQGGFGNVGGIVEEVVNRYIASNGLSDLSVGNGRLLAKEVFQALYNASANPGKPFFPEPSELHRSEFYGIVDINVETKKRKPIFVNEHYPYSIAISEALSIVLLGLLGVEGSLAATWSQFEVLCAKNELQHLVRGMDPRVLKWKGVKIIPLKNPFPAPNAKSTFQVPTMSKNTVFVNRPMAPFADVFAPNRVSQCKFVSDSEKSASLGLGEFVKMGIVKELLNEESSGKGKEQTKVKDNLNLQLARNGALLSALVAGWKEDALFEDDQDGRESKVLADAGVRTPQQFYPYGQLVSKETAQQPRCVEFTYTEEDGKLTNESGCHHKDDPLDEMVEAVFYSNGKSFSINHGTGTEQKAVVVEPKDVKVDGRCIDPKKKDEIVNRLGMKLRENVEFRFIFARNYNRVEQDSHN